MSTTTADRLAAFAAQSRARAAAATADRPAAAAARGLTLDGFGVVSQVIRGAVTQHIHVNGCMGECGDTFPAGEVTPFLLSVVGVKTIVTAPLAQCAAAAVNA